MTAGLMVGCTGPHEPCTRTVNPFSGLRDDDPIAQMAIALSPPSGASGSIYARLSRDLEAAFHREPQLRSFRYMPTDDGRTLVVKLSAPRALFSKFGGSHGLDCLNAQLGGKVLQQAGAFITIRFDELRNLDQAAELYAALDGVEYAEARPYARIDEARSACITTSAARWHYILRVERPAAALFHFSTTANGEVSDVESWAFDSRSVPDWKKVFWEHSICD